jgi:hypothetical protein
MGNNERAAWLAGIYDNPAVRDHMTEVCLDLMTWASMRGRGDEARTWLMLHRTLKLSLIAWPVAARHGATVTVQPTTRKATS